MQDLSPPGPVRMQRAHGEARVEIGPRGLERLRQSGSAKAMLPRTDGGPEVVFLNTAGGLTGGDRFGFALRVGAGRAMGSTQTAERAYASAGGAARMDVALEVGRGARLDWLPQETILYDRSALDRRTRVDLAADGAVLLAEMLVLGREAMGETVRTLDLTDRREVWRAGRPALVEPLRLTGEVLADRSPALIGGARALATLAFVAPGAEGSADALRAEAPQAAVSGWNGRAVLRLMGEAGAVRSQLARAVRRLAGRVPRVWPR